MNITPRFGEGFRVVYQDVNPEYTQALRTQYDIELPPLDKSRRLSLAKLLGGRAMVVRASNPYFQNEDFILVDGPRQDTFTQAKENLEKVKEFMSVDDPGFTQGFSWVLQVKNLLNGNESDVTVRHDVFGNIENPDEVLQNIGLKK